MKRVLAGVALIVAAAALSGCYYDPGYSYVRDSSYSGDAYYGRSAPVYDEGYSSGYYGAPGYYDSYGYGGYGCCYSSGVSVGVYGSSHRDHDRDERGEGNYRRGDERGHEGHWQGQTAREGHPQDRDDSRSHHRRDHDGDGDGDRDHTHR